MLIAFVESSILTFCYFKSSTINTIHCVRSTDWKQKQSVKEGKDKGKERDSREKQGKKKQTKLNVLIVEKDNKKERDTGEKEAGREVDKEVEKRYSERSTYNNATSSSQLAQIFKSYGWVVRF